MESTEIKSLPFLGAYKAMGNIFVPALGAILLLVVALQFSRHSSGTARLSLVAIAMGVGVIGLSYYKLRRELSRLEGKISDPALSTLCQTANTMAMFGYVICLSAFTVALHL